MPFIVLLAIALVMLQCTSKKLTKIIGGATEDMHLDAIPDTAYRFSGCTIAVKCGVDHARKR